MIQKNNQNIEDLLIRYFEGDLSETEKMQVEDWINESQDNYKLAQQIQMIFMASDSIAVMKKVDVDKARKKVEARIRKDRFNSVVKYLQKIAAVLFIPLALLLLYQVLSDNDSEERTLEVRTNPGMTTKIALSDGTIVHLNSESLLTYPETFGKEERVVSLDGEAYFDVTKDPEKRFIVKTPHQSSIEVTGTSFNVEAFSADSTISTTLISGSVSFKTNSGTIYMKPGEKLIYNFNTNQGTVFQTKGLSESAWKDGRIVFDNTPFNDALHILSKRFNVEFVVANDRYERYSFTGSFSNHRVEQILKVFKASSGINWKYIQSDNDDKNKILIY